VRAYYDADGLAIECNCGEELCEHVVAVLKGRTHRLARVSTDAPLLARVGGWLRLSGLQTLLTELDVCSRAVSRLAIRGAPGAQALVEAKARHDWIRRELAQALRLGRRVSGLPAEQIDLTTKAKPPAPPAAR